MRNRRFLIVVTLVGVLFLSVMLGRLSLNHEAGSAASGGRLLSSLRQMDYGLVINVSDYDGATDGERIQKALNDVPQDGATVFIPDGVWQACNLTALSRTVILGADGAILERPENTTSAFVTFDNKTGFAVTNLIFDGQNIPDAYGVLASNSTSFEISNNTFRDVTNNAIHIDGWSTDFVIENNVLVNTNIAPILVFGTPGSRIISRFLIANNTLMDSLDNGKIGVAFADNGTIADNHVVNCTYGIATRCVSDLTVSGNRVENVTSFGIYLGTQPGDFGSWNITIENNIIVGADIGIARWYGSGSVVNVTVIENTIAYSDQSDIYADFQASFIRNTVSSREKVKITTIPSEFAFNVDVNGTPVIPADINGDRRVDMRDLGIVARLFGITRGSAEWNPLADVIVNDAIDMRDVSFVARCFGLSF